jgi:hypothetical protein
LCGLLTLVATVEGCQRGSTWNLAPVEGTVTKNGRPLPHIQVLFVADLDAGTQGPQTNGITDKDGHYRLRSGNGEEGAVVGKHRVLVIDLEASVKQQVGRAARGSRQKEIARLPPEIARRSRSELKTVADAPRVPPSYGRFSETPLRAEIGHKPLVFDIVIP